MLDAQRCTDVADALLAAAEMRRPIRPLSEVWPDLDALDAYAIQTEIVRRRAASGARIVGRKVGLTSKAMQEQLGVYEPDYGCLFDDMCVPNGGTMPSSRLLQSRIELEIAFVLKEPLTGPDVTLSEAIDATETVAPALEIIDSRFGDWKITLVDTVADNGSAAAFVIGGARVDPARLDLQAIEASLSRNGAVVATGTSAAVLGHPGEAVAWLARKLSSLGAVVEAGQLILSGSCVRAVPVAPGDTFIGVLEGLGSVSVSFS